MNRILISGTNSGCGKTTVTCALINAFKLRGLDPVTFKSGPDYIDPMFHRAVSGIKAYNLDPFFLDGEGLRKALAYRAGEFNLIEGAMGYYDGIAGGLEASTYKLACETGTPVILVISAKGASGSLKAVIEGFVRHRPDSMIGGVIFNDAGGSRWCDLKRMAREAGVRAYGYMPYIKEWELPHRHLGLLPAEEIENIRDRLDRLGQTAAGTMDMDGIIDLAKTASPMNYIKACGIELDKKVKLRLGVAKDRAFCFIYEENMDMLRGLGCETVYFSPINDKELPPCLDGLYICGGYPEVYAAELEKNITMRKSIKKEVLSGLPTVAEGGGFMFLHEDIDGHSMCGVIGGSSFETKKLQRFGYITLKANKSNMLCKQGEPIRAHEFHYWDSNSLGDSYTAQKAGRDISYPCVHATDTLYAGFPQIYFPANPLFAENFVDAMAMRGGRRSFHKFTN